MISTMVPSQMGVPQDRDPPSSANCFYLLRPEPGWGRESERGRILWSCTRNLHKVILASGLLLAIHSLNIREGLTRAILSGTTFGDWDEMVCVGSHANGREGGHCVDFRFGPGKASNAVVDGHVGGSLTLSSLLL
ncbi:hypothetical protein ACLB2K_041583 [Fragaria x ananassa]